VHNIALKLLFGITKIEDLESKQFWIPSFLHLKVLSSEFEEESILSSNNPSL
jgi:hypothetical protein